MAPKKTPAALRFWKSVEKTDSGCWLWTGTTTVDGYGHFSVGSRSDGSRRMVRAHRVAWRLAHGKIPDGYLVLHKCDRPACVNPAHLFLGTHIENMADMRKKGRSLNGRRNPNAKLTEDQVREIRHRYMSGGTTQKKLAAAYGVNQSMISKIVRGDNWKKVGRG